MWPPPHCLVALLAGPRRCHRWHTRTTLSQMVQQTRRLTWEPPHVVRNIRTPPDLCDGAMPTQLMQPTHIIQCQLTEGLLSLRNCQSLQDCRCLPLASDCLSWCLSEGLGFPGRCSKMTDGLGSRLGDEIRVDLVSPSGSCPRSRCRAVLLHKGQEPGAFSGRGKRLVRGSAPTIWKTPTPGPPHHAELVSGIVGGRALFPEDGAGADGSEFGVGRWVGDSGHGGPRGVASQGGHCCACRLGTIDCCHTWGCDLGGPTVAAGIVTTTSSYSAGISIQLVEWWKVPRRSSCSMEAKLGTLTPATLSAMLIATCCKYLCALTCMASMMQA
jgi:hypothetical protein